MRIEIKSLSMGAFLGAAIFFGMGAASSESPRYQLQAVAHKSVFRMEVTSGTILQWNGLSWKNITPPK